MPATVDMIITDAVLAVIESRDADAESALASLPIPALFDTYDRDRGRVWRGQGIGIKKMSSTPKPRRSHIPERVKLDVFRSDAFTCRYAHCRRRTIYLPVLKVLSALFPELLPCRRAWAPAREHMIYLLYSTSLEHVVPLAQGGEDARSNWVTSCYGCNDLKGHLHMEDLEWTLADPASSDWDGLVRFLPQLQERKATGRAVASN